jgi:protein arginine N-methyltransferase 2
MKQQGWYDKPGVVVHEGRWQDILPKLAQDEGELVFDAIFFDTFAEGYSALREFFSESVVQFLDSEGKFSYFNGLGADRQVCYDVYIKVAEMDLFEAGFDVNWEESKVEDLQERGEWTGIRRPYWNLDTYKLPTCTFVG